MLRFFTLFLVVQAVLFGAELTPWAQTHIVLPWTNALAGLAAFLVTLFDPGVVAVGKVLRSASNGFAVSIEAGCNGIEASLVLVAAVLAFPAPWRSKVVGLVAGLGAVRAGEEEMVARADHPETRRRVEAERACVFAIGGGCLAPVAAHHDGEQLTALVAAEDGSWLERRSGDDPAELARELLQFAAG